MKWINPLKTWQVSCLWLINRKRRQIPRIPDLWSGLFSITKSPGLGENFVDILKFSIFHQYKDKVIFFLNHCTILFCGHRQGLSNDLERSQTLEAVIFFFSLSFGYWYSHYSISQGTVRWDLRFDKYFHYLPWIKWEWLLLCFFTLFAQVIHGVFVNGILGQMVSIFLYLLNISKLH